MHTCIHSLMQPGGYTTTPKAPEGPQCSPELNHQPQSPGGAPSTKTPLGTHTREPCKRIMNPNGLDNR